MQADGRIQFYSGDIYAPRKIDMKSDTQKRWERCYWRCKNAKKPMTFSNARGLFFVENGYWPPSDLPLMPMDKVDWFRSIDSVPKERLYPPVKREEE